MLDEPTNDLDLDTLELLEEQIAVYGGTVLVISHDRAFLNNVVTGTLAFEKGRPDAPGEWLGPDDGWFVNEYAGGYDDWAERRRQPPAAAPPVRERPLPRPSPPPVAGRKKRLNEAQRREIESLPGRIEALEAEQAQWHARLADPAFYRQGDGAEIARGRRRTEELPAELEAAYSRWAELDALAAAGAPMTKGAE